MLVICLWPVPLSASCDVCIKCTILGSAVSANSTGFWWLRPAVGPETRTGWVQADAPGRRRETAMDTPSLPCGHADTRTGHTGKDGQRRENKSQQRERAKRAEQAAAGR